MNQQPKALRLAEHLENFRSFPNDMQAAAELRRLHAENEQLRQALQNLITVTQHLEVCPGTLETAQAAVNNVTRNMK